MSERRNIPFVITCTYRRRRRRKTGAIYIIGLNDMRWTAYEESDSRKEEEMGPVIKGEMIERDPKKKGENGVSIYLLLKRLSVKRNKLL